jgi:hypothetical protein
MKIFTFIHKQLIFIVASAKNQKNWIYTLSSRVILLCFIVSIAAIIWRWNLLPPFIPIWYSKAWGVERLAPLLWIFLLPIFSLIWHGVNILLSIYLMRDHYIFSQVLFVSSMFVAVFSLILVVNIVFLIT